MTDPFYQNQKQNPNVQQQAVQTQGVSPQSSAQQTQAQLQAIQAQQIAQQKAQLEQQLQTLTQQETTVRQQLQQLNNLWQNPQLTPEQRQQIQAQGTQLNQQLANILHQKQQLNWQINKVVVKPKIKKWSKIHMKGFLMWCGIFLVLLLWWAAAVFYSFIQNPDKLANIWLSVGTATQLLQAFVSIFFGLLVFAGFGLLIVNIYRLFSVKNKKKWWYIGGTLLWLILLVASATAWIWALNKVKHISPDTGFDSQNLLISYASFKDGPKLIKKDMQLIAPMNTLYTLNGALFNSQVMSKLWSIDIKQLSVDLDCGNGKKLPLNLNNLQFEWSCLFVDKWKYTYTLQIHYVNPQTQEKLEKDIDAWTISFRSAIKITSNNEVRVNKAGTEINLWKIPSKTTFDATDVFADFGLSNYIITWDVNDDGTVDRENDTMFSYIYKKAQVYNVTFRIPALNNLAYTFPVRLEPSDVPICEIQSTELKWSKYTIHVNFLDNTNIITDYIYNIVDVQNNNRTIDTLNSQDDTFTYEFPWKWVFAIQTTFQTDEWKKGSCESDNIKIWDSDFAVNYSVSSKTPSDPNFVAVNSENGLPLKNDTLIVGEIPTILQIHIDSISPTTVWTTKKVFLDDKQILSLDDKNYELPIDQNKDYLVKLVVEDSNRDMHTEKTFKVSVRRDDIIWKLLIKPDTVGTDPFDVQFDASTTVVNDPDDEIVYFTRDFGDGEIKKDVSQAIISHEYHYDYDKNNGSYEASVTLKTKKWREITIHPDNAIIVKKANKTFTINIDSHPGQLAKVWDIVKFSLDLDTLPEKILWDFGDGKTLECKERECIETNKIYNTPGTYKIKVKVIDDKSPLSDSTITLKVEE